MGFREPNSSIEKRGKMRKFFVGMLIGLLIGIPLAWAASRAVLVDGTGVEISASNPLVIQTN
jgi:hypothetical protein